MARNEQDREDLLAEATALVERIELAVEGVAESVVIGFRRDGCASIYFGGDPVYHFNSRLELRRGFAAGELYKAEHGRLVSLQRQRTGQEVQLLRQELDDAAQETFLQQCEQHLTHLRTQLAAGRFELRGQVPGDADLVTRVRSFLEKLPMPIRAASSPHAH
jgi:hypothetical protein